MEMTYDQLVQALARFHISAMAEAEADISPGDLSPATIKEHAIDFFKDTLNGFEASVIDQIRQTEFTTTIKVEVEFR